MIEVVPIAEPTSSQETEPLFADAHVIHTAVMDTIDKGDLGLFHLWHPFPDVANDARERFVDAIQKRIRELQAPPFSLGVRLEYFCDTHKRLRLPAPVQPVGECPDCVREREQRESASS